MGEMYLFGKITISKITNINAIEYRNKFILSEPEKHATSEFYK